jgi:hypothetical protein
VCLQARLDFLFLCLVPHMSSCFGLHLEVFLLYSIIAGINFISGHGLFLITSKS